MVKDERLCKVDAVVLLELRLSYMRYQELVRCCLQSAEIRLKVYLIQLQQIYFLVSLSLSLMYVFPVPAASRRIG